MNKAHITSIGLSTPSFRVEQKLAGEILSAHCAGKISPRSLALLRKLFVHPSIKYRSYAVDDSETIFRETPDERISRFTRYSIDLSADAVMKALREAGTAIDEVKALVVNTCTGYICPGISTYLIERLGLPCNTAVYDLVGSGCGGAIPNLQVAKSLLPEAGAGAVISVSVEICSATFQMSDDLSLIVSNALFGDGAAATVLSRKQSGMELVDAASIYVPGDREHIRYIHKNGELHNQLSMGLHRHVRTAVADVVSTLLKRHSLQMSDVAHWALHTGGEKILDSIRDEIGLPEARLEATRSILSDYGNMSSPTVLFVLKRLLDGGIERGDWCMMVSFGAGLSAHAFLLRRS